MIERSDGKSICCTRPKYLKAWIPCWPFSATYCANCGEVNSTCHPVIDWIWQLFVWPFWNGKVAVEDPEGLVNE